MKNLNKTIEQYRKLEKVRKSMSIDLSKARLTDELAADLVMSMAGINAFGLDTNEVERLVQFVESFCLTMPTANMANEVLSLFDSNPTYCPYSKEVFRKGLRFGLINGEIPALDYVRYSPCDVTETLDIDFISTFEGQLFYKRAFNIVDPITVEFAIKNVRRKFIDVIKSNEQAWREATASI